MCSNPAGPVTAIPQIPRLPFQSQPVRPHPLGFLHLQVVAYLIKFKLSQLGQLSQLIQPVRESACCVEVVYFWPARSLYYIRDIVCFLVLLFSLSKNTLSTDSWPFQWRGWS